MFLLLLISDRHKRLLSSDHYMNKSKNMDPWTQYTVSETDHFFTQVIMYGTALDTQGGCK